MRGGAGRGVACVASHAKYPLNVEGWAVSYETTTFQRNRFPGPRGVKHVERDRFRYLLFQAVNEIPESQRREQG